MLLKRKEPKSNMDFAEGVDRSWLTSVFSSDRERRLWLWALVVVVAIYSTLGPAPEVVGALRERNLLRVTVVVAVLLVVVPVVWRWARRRPGWDEVGVGVGVALSYWMVALRVDNPAERTHLFEYGIVAALIYAALLERGRNGRPVKWPAALTVAVTAVLGLVDEGIQAVLPNRVFDWNDVLFNAFAGAMVIVARLALAPVRRLGWRLWFWWFLGGAVGWDVSMDSSLFGERTRVELLDSLPSLTVPAFSNVAVGGLLVGVFQWLAVRRHLSRPARWLSSSAGAVAVGGLIVLAVRLVDADSASIAGVVFYGTVVGVLQWLVLRDHSAHAGWWVVVSTVGWLLAFPVGDAMGPPGWSVYGALTGAVLVWLLRGSIGVLPEESSGSVEIDP
ncbi:MAG: VanZ family protein [Acidimicrobiaceae bacterium]|nr:VanZ family protein [Acidimicrobiaceae bacterium]MYA73731.1 VanZ family protein [Acidimicrobiaceae bacterium]MYG56920.1 VanZ family protein [Acidimicrobiaceae bacterium]MYI58028.1 VanZ family protein [Acidimicrobiaceae bacterium]